MTTVVIVYGPKAAGKSYLSRALEGELGIYHIDPDALVLEWIKQGLRADLENGWLQEIVAAVKFALETRNAVSLEATGAWDSDWKLPELLKDAGHDVITIRLLIDPATAMSRLSTRKEERIPISASEAEHIWKAADARRGNRKSIWRSMRRIPISETASFATSEKNYARKSHTGGALVFLPRLRGRC